MITLQWFREADPARSAPTMPEGYKEREIRTIIRLRTDGTFVDATVRPAKEPLTVTLPYTQRSSGYYADVVDNYEYVFGAGAPGRDPKDALERGRAYRAHLARFDHPATRAILRFLATAPPVVPLGDTSPEIIAAVESTPRKTGDVPQNHAAKATLKKPEWIAFWACTLDGARLQAGQATAPIYTEDLPRGFVLFEVEGHPEWWMDAVFQADKKAARSASQGDVLGRCSLCYRTNQPLARLLDSTTLSKGPSISSFNVPSFTAFNRAQNYTAPTCQECAGQMVRGFNAITEAPHTAKMTPASVYHALLWWDATLALDLWGSIFDVALDADRPRTERLAALDRIPAESYFLDVRQNERRLAFLRHAYVTRNALHARLRRAIEANLDFNRAVKALCAVGSGADRDENNSGNATKDKKLAVFWREALLIDLIGGEPLGARDVRAIWDAASTARRPYNQRAIRALIAYLQPGEIYMQPSTPEEIAAFALGRAIAHVDRVQYRNNQAAVPHSATMLRRAQQQPAHVRTRLMDRSWYRAKTSTGKRLIQDRHVLQFYSEARDTPERRLTLREITALQDGFVSEREHIFATFKKLPDEGSDASDVENEFEATAK